MGTTIICGSMLYVVGIGEKIEESLSSNIPMYKGMMFNKNEFWNNAKDGFISGQIIFTDGKMVKIIDSNNNTWILNIDKTNVRGRTKIQEGEFVKIIGDIEEDNIFIPEDIRPWQGKKMR